MESSVNKPNNYLNDISEIKVLERLRQNQIDDKNIESGKKWKFYSYKDYRNKVKEANSKNIYTASLVFLPHEVHIFFEICKTNQNFDKFSKAFLFVLEHKLSPIKSESDKFSLVLQFRYPRRTFFDVNFNNVSLEINSIKLFTELSNFHIRILEAEHECEKKILIYQSPVDFLYINAFIFIYLIKKLENVNNNYTYAMNELVEIFTKFDNEVFDFTKRDHNEIIKYIKEFLRRKTINMALDINGQRYDEKNAFVKVMHQRYKLKASDNKIESVSNDTIGWSFNDINKPKSNKNGQNSMKTYEKSVDVIDQTYEFWVKNMVEDEEFKGLLDFLPYLGFAEEKVKEIRQNESPVSIFKSTIENNLRIREILVKNRLIGVIGLKKAGKSTFVETITKSKISSSVNETTELSAYAIAPDINLLLVDYPHYNSDNEFYKVLFRQSMFMLDYLFLVVDTEQIGGTSTDDFDLLLGDLLDFGLSRIFVILNKYDNVLMDLKNKEDVVVHVNKIKSKIYKNLMEIAVKRGQFLDRSDLENNLKILPTCMNTNIMNLELLIRAGVLFGNSLKKFILDTFSFHIFDRKLQLQLNEFIRSGKYEEIINKKECTFFYQGKKLLVGLSKEQMSWNEVLGIIKEEFSLSNKFLIKAKSGNLLIDNFEKFFFIDNIEFEIVCN